MSIVFRCPSCGKKLAANDKSAGKLKTCPRCQSKVTVPSAERSGDSLERKSAARPLAPRTAHDAPLTMPMRSAHRGELIDMTAMVDIVFFLLIFFLVTSMQSLEAVIDLPTPQAEGAADSVQAVPDYANDPSYIVVTIDADDTIWVEDEEATSEQDLRSKLRAARREDADRDGLLVNGSPDATHGTFVMVLDAGADAGLKELLFSVPQSEEAGGG